MISNCYDIKYKYYISDESLMFICYLDFLDLTMNAKSVLESFLFTFLLMLDTCCCQLYSRYHTHIMLVDFQEGNLHFSVLLRSQWNQLLN